MPVSGSSWQTSQPYVPSPEVGKLPGVQIHFETLAQFQAASAQEQNNVNVAGVPLWLDGTSITNGGEPGVSRRWNKSAAHARLASFGSNRTLAVTGDSNTVLSGTGAPGAGVGSNGDLYVDWAAGVYGPKAAGAWPSTPAITLASGGAAVPITVSGLTAVGSLMTATIAAGWVNTGGNWTRTGATISGATGLTYTSTSADAGQSLTYVSANIPFIPTGITVAGTAVDSDVAAYATAVTTAGGTLPTTHQAALNTEIAALKASGAWALIKEWWIPLGADGDLTTAAVKFKRGATSPTVALTNFVSSDYTVALGLNPQSGNPNKTVNTNFNPSFHTVNGALVNTDWGFSFYSVRQSTTGVVMGTFTGSSAYSTNSSAQAANISGVSVSAPATQMRRLYTVQQGSGTAQTFTGGYQLGSTAAASPSALPNTTLSLLSVGGSFWSDAVLGGYVIHQALTPAQLRAVQTFIDNVSQSIGRTIFAEALAGIGDSYTASPPTGPSVPANDYIALVGTAKGWGYSLRGNSGVGWSNGGGGAVTNQQIYDNVFNRPTKRMLFPFGINDAATTGSTASGVSTAAGAKMDMLIQQGIPAAYIAMGTLYPWTGLPDQTLAANIAAAERAVATAKGVKLVDFFTGSTAGVTSYENGIHKTDSGHAALANDLTAAIAGWGGW